MKEAIIIAKDKVLHKSNYDVDISEKYGEVFTSFELIEKILDDLPSEYFTDSQKTFLDPCAGKGNFPICILERLFEGLKDEIPNDEERLKHIVENQLYMIEIQKESALFLKKVFSFGGLCKPNVKKADFLDYGNINTAVRSFEECGFGQFQQHNKKKKMETNINDKQILTQTENNVDHIKKYVQQKVKLNWDQCECSYLDDIVWDTHNVHQVLSSDDKNNVFLCQRNSTNLEKLPYYYFKDITGHYVRTEYSSVHNNDFTGFYSTSIQKAIFLLLEKLNGIVQNINEQMDAHSIYIDVRQKEETLWYDDGQKYIECVDYHYINDIITGFRLNFEIMEIPIVGWVQYDRRYNVVDFSAWYGITAFDKDGVPISSDKIDKIIREYEHNNQQPHP